jgi:hypothetical protein
VTIVVNSWSVQEVLASGVGHEGQNWWGRIPQDLKGGTGGATDDFRYLSRSAEGCAGVRSQSCVLDHGPAGSPSSVVTCPIEDTAAPPVMENWQASFHRSRQPDLFDSQRIRLPSAKEGESCSTALPVCGTLICGPGLLNCGVTGCGGTYTKPFPTSCLTRGGESK